MSSMSVREACVQIVLKLAEEMRDLVHRMAAMELAVIQVGAKMAGALLKPATPLVQRSAAQNYFFWSCSRCISGIATC